MVPVAAAVPFAAPATPAVPVAAAPVARKKVGDRVAAAKKKAEEAKNKKRAELQLSANRHAAQHQHAAQQLASAQQREQQLQAEEQQAQRELDILQVQADRRQQQQQQQRTEEQLISPDPDPESPRLDAQAKARVEASAAAAIDSPQFDASIEAGRQAAMAECNGENAANDARDRSQSELVVSNTHTELMSHTRSELMLSSTHTQRTSEYQCLHWMVAPHCLPPHLKLHSVDAIDSLIISPALITHCAVQAIEREKQLLDKQQRREARRKREERRVSMELEHGVDISSSPPQDELFTAVAQPSQGEGQAENQQVAAQQAKYRETKLAEVFALFDLDGNGSVEAQELMVLGLRRRELGHVDGGWSEKQNEKLVQAMDTNGDGKIQQSEFCQYFSQALALDTAKFENVITQFKEVAQSCKPNVDAAAVKAEEHSCGKAGGKAEGSTRKKVHEDMRIAGCASVRLRAMWKIAAAM